MEIEDQQAIESLIPQRMPMRLIDIVLEADDDHIKTLAIVKETWPLCNERGADMILTLEVIAQSVAALYHGRKKRRGEPQIDFLVGIKEARFQGIILPLQGKLRVDARLISTIGNYGIFQGEVRLGEELLCEALIQVLEPGEELREALIGGRAGEVRANG